MFIDRGGIVSLLLYLPRANARWKLAAERSSNRRITCLLHIISDVTRVGHAQGTTLSILRAFIACAAAVQTAVLVLFGPSCLGHYRPLQRRSASDKYSARCRPIKQTQFTATFDQNLPSIKYIFAFFSKIYRKYCLRDDVWRSKFLETYFRKHTNTHTENAFMWLQ